MPLDDAGFWPVPSNPSVTTCSAAAGAGGIGTPEQWGQDDSHAGRRRTLPPMNRILARVFIVASLGGLLGVAGPVAPCDPDGSDFCGLERAEDVVFLPGTSWFAVSHAAADASLVFIDTRSRRRVAVAAPFTATAALPRPAARTARADTRGGLGAADCPGPPSQLHAGGNDVRRFGAAFRLIVLNKSSPAPATSSGPDRIEFFSIEIRDRAPQARWAGCIIVPGTYSLNDVALAADGTVYGSHQFDRPVSPADAAATRQKWLDGRPTGYAVQWQAPNAWRRVPDTEVSFANGIAVSRDDRLLAVAGTYSKALVLVDRRRGTTRRITLPHTPDNISALEDGSFLSVGHTGLPVIGVDPCRPAEAVPCGFPFSVVHVVDGRNGEAARIRVLLEHDGSRIPGRLGRRASWRTTLSRLLLRRPRHRARSAARQSPYTRQTGG